MNLQNSSSSANTRNAVGNQLFASLSGRTAELLTESDCPSVLEFLKMRPVHTVVMTSFIQDNGLENSANRGAFYGYRNDRGALEAVALIGHTTLIEARSKDSVTAFAAVARQSEVPIHLIMSDEKTTDIFWRSYAGDHRPARKVCTELFFELNLPIFVQQCDWQVRLAAVEELEAVAVAHDEVAFIESGVSPLLRDREGFLKRCKRRIEQKRTFVVFDGGNLVFKADIAAETSDVVYLEGIYVAPEYRGRGIGSSCLSKLSRNFRARFENVCLLSNVEFTGAHRSFVKAGFKSTGSCQTLFV